MASRRKNACEFPEDVRKRIIDRDGGCIYCQMGYDVNGQCGYGLQIMHYIPRSQGGRGVERNGAVGCLYHHGNLDNSPKRQEMMALYRRYLMIQYDDWNENELVYDKWEGMKHE